MTIAEKNSVSGFNAIRISLASSDQIKSWSFGEVTKPETLNYRTLKPEKDGLFCERIFGPTKDWECHCGKYKRARYKGIICDKCGVEVTKSQVRRERLGHIKLISPVAHIWFSKGAPPQLGLITGIVQNDLDKIIYFAQYIITSTDEAGKEAAIAELKEGMENATSALQEQLSEAIGENRVNELLEQELEVLKERDEAPDFDKDLSTSSNQERLEYIFKEIKIPAMEQHYAQQIEDVKSLKPSSLITERRYRELKASWNDLFEADMGAEALYKILQQLDLKKELEKLNAELDQISGQVRRRAIKRIRLIRSFLKSGVKPEWMILTTLPVLPTELRPMVQMGGVRFASSSLNDLYRRVISCNNRLRYLVKIQAPQIMVRNEKRMLQESVDALIDNSRRQNPISGHNNRSLRSLTDLLRGKQGRFRQNLLGKRVDYSGRAVITSGPGLKMHQCGLPKHLALELFKPFVIRSLIERGYTPNIKSAKRMIESFGGPIWDLLEEVIQDHPVLLNRAPTLHRLGIQAFYPTLTEGAAIRLHPLVCTAFNADFDGDQMAVHVPLSKEAVTETKRLILSTNNLLALRSGAPIVLPTLDMILGIYYMTSVDDVRFKDVEVPVFNKLGTARLMFHFKKLDLRQPIRVYRDVGEYIDTTVGRIIFNQDVFADEEFPEIEKLRRYDITFDRPNMQQTIADCFEMFGNQATVNLLDRIKDIGFEFATQSGNSVSMHDITVPDEKRDIVRRAQRRVQNLETFFEDGMLNQEEFDRESIKVWMEMSESVTDAVKEHLPEYGGIYTMTKSGAKGNIAQIKQMVGMRGLMADPKGRIIKMPILSSFAEGLSIYEYFISSHGARKGLADTALRTADSGYLTRRLVDVSQEIIVLSEDCGTINGMEISAMSKGAIKIPLWERIASRVLMDPVVHPETGEVLFEAGTMLTARNAKAIDDAGVKTVNVRSPLSCVASAGICSQCYGSSLANNQKTLVGEAVGVIAAQSIGEPGTQLTMRTFHTGGIVGQDITVGLPRVVEIFEARRPKGGAVIAEVGGIIKLENTPEGRRAGITSEQDFQVVTEIPDTHKLTVKNGQKVATGQTILVPKKTALKADDSLKEVVSEQSGTANTSGGKLTITRQERDHSSYNIPLSADVIVEDGDRITPGQPITAGPINPHDILRLLGHSAVEKYIVEEIQNVYRSQGVGIHDKHIEVISRQMLRKVKISRSGDTDAMPGEILDKSDYARMNEKTTAAGGTPAQAVPILMGVTRASLTTRSFLSAASFQETSRVLTEAALRGAVDQLEGLKENVIVGHLIPANLLRTQAGRDKLGWTEVEQYHIEARRRQEAALLEEAEREAERRSLRAEEASAQPTPVTPDGTDVVAEVDDSAALDMLDSVVDEPTAADMSLEDLEQASSESENNDIPDAEVEETSE